MEVLVEPVAPRYPRAAWDPNAQAYATPRREVGT